MKKTYLTGIIVGVITTLLIAIGLIIQYIPIIIIAIIIDIVVMAILGFFYYTNSHNNK